MLAVGIWAKVDDNFSDYVEIVNYEGSNPYFDHAVWLIIAIGAIIFLLGFLGCCGACCESPTMLLFVSTKPEFNVINKVSLSKRRFI